MSHPHKLLFICSQNRLRSLTAEAMADINFVMERKHGRILREKFGEALEGKTVICLRIPDDYRYMEPAWIDKLIAALSGYVEVPA